LLGDGHGSFEAAPDCAVGSSPSSVAVADFNTDGKPDLVTANQGNGAGSVSVLLGNGDGTFQPARDDAAGSYSRSVAVGDFNGDPLNERSEAFSVNLSGPTNATLADAQGVGTILNDDPVPSLAISDVTLKEGNSGATNFVFTVNLSAASGQPVTVNFATANGT